MAKKYSFSIYKYDHASDFLRDIFVEIKTNRPSYSIRAWSKHLNFENPTSLARTLSDQRALPASMIPAICESLQMSPHERAYFELISVGKNKFSPQSFEILKNALRTG